MANKKISPKLRKSKNKLKPPDKIVVFDNKEKAFQEQWTKDRNLANFPHSFRLIASGKPGSGKTNAILNVFLHINPPFKKIYLLHCGDDVKEYQDLDYEKLDEIPAPNDPIFDRKVKTLLILEDRSLNNLNKEQFYRLDRLYGFCSSHLSVSICTNSQSLFTVPKVVRDMSNVFLIWKTRDSDMMKCIGRRLGLTKEEMMMIIREHIIEPHDFLVLDDTFNTPYPLRKNIFEILPFNDIYSKNN
jgi:hypothetical protein